MKRDLIKKLKNFDLYSKCINFDDFYMYRNRIDFENIDNFKERYFIENYVFYKNEKMLIDNIIDFMHNKEDLIYNKILIKENNILYINRNGYNEYLNIFNSIERFFKKYEKITTFIIGMITGGGIIGFITLINFIF